MITFGGSTAGSLTLRTELGNGAILNWLPGTKMEMTVANEDEWAETEWAAGRLLYNGQSKSDMGNKTWTQVTAADGLAPGVSFEYDSTSETLKLALPAPTPDSDGDGMDDAWESNYFNNLDQTADGDFDGDGVANYFEYLYGSDETDSAGTKLIASPSGENTLFSWKLKEGFVQGDDYIIEISSELGSWDTIDTVIPGGYTITESDPDANGRVTLEVRITDPGYTTKVFIRLTKPLLPSS
jgi:hypothetical protein